MSEATLKTQADLWIAAHDAATKTVGMKNAAEIEQARLDAFKSAGFTAAIDYESFTTFFKDARIVVTNLSTQPLRSEALSKTVS